MPFNGSGGTTQPAGSIYPATANTLIESAKANTSIADLYTMLASVICKDGQTTTTQRIPFAAGASMGSQTITAVADGTATTHAATLAQVRNGASTVLGTVAGTNTITAALTPALAAYASGNKFVFVPANTNTGATTLNIDSVGAKNIFWNGAACVGGELRANIPILVEYDGTQFHIIANGFNAPFLDTHAVVEGSADSTKKVRFEVDGLTTATTRVITVPDSDLTLSTGAATQAEQETGTNTTAFVTPGRQQFHPSAAKGWINGGSGGGTPAARVSYNVSSLTDIGVGLVGINWTTAFSSGDYCSVGGVGEYGIAVFNMLMGESAGGNRTTSLQRFQTLTPGAVNTDIVEWNVASFGDR